MHLKSSHTPPPICFQLRALRSKLKREGKTVSRLIKGRESYYFMGSI